MKNRSLSFLTLEKSASKRSDKKNTFKAKEYSAHCD